MNKTPKSLPLGSFHSKGGDLGPGTSCSLWHNCSFRVLCQLPLVLQVSSLEVTRLAQEEYDGSLEPGGGNVRSG